MLFFLSVNKILHIIAAIVGTLSATAEEILYLKNIRDGKIDEAEAKQLRITYKLMHLSLIVLVFTGFGILAAVRIKYGGTDAFYSPFLWAKYAIILILLANAALIAARKIPLWLASPLSLTSWWAAFIFGKIASDIREGEFEWLKFFFSQFNFIGTFLILMFCYAFGVLIAAWLLNYVKKKIARDNFS